MVNGYAYTGSGRKLFHEIHFSPAFIFKGVNMKIVSVADGNKSKVWKSAMFL
jgi:hypothetical protein